MLGTGDGQCAEMKAAGTGNLKEKAESKTEVECCCRLCMDVFFLMDWFIGVL